MTIEENFLIIRGLIRRHGKDVMNKLFDDYFSLSINNEISPSCILCGTIENITKEHVLPRWVFEGNTKHSFKTDVNQLDRTFMNSTVPACHYCNSILLNGIEIYIQKTLSKVNLRTNFYTEIERLNIIRWLELIDFKFQVLDITTKYRAHKTRGFIPSLTDWPIALVRDLSIVSISSKARLSLKRISIKNKSNCNNSLMVGSTIKKTFHYFHKSGQFMHLELPTYNKGFFYFFDKSFKNNSLAVKEGKKIINLAYKEN